MVGLTEDVDGNIWAECAGKARKLVRIRDFQVVEEFTSSQVPPGHTLAADPRGGIWIGALERGSCTVSSAGAMEKFSLQPKGERVSHQIIANADGSVLAASDDGLVGVRQGKVQRLTKKNGLPCNSVISFIEDRAKRWWLYTECGVVESAGFRDPALVGQSRGSRSNPCIRRSGRCASAGNDHLSIQRPLLADGQVWFANGSVLQMVDPSRLSQKAPPAETYIESVIVDRKEFIRNANLKSRRTPETCRLITLRPRF